MDTTVITVRTGDRPVVRDITGEAEQFVSGRGDGLLHVFVPHATAGVAIIETGAGSDEDLLTAIDELLPAEDKWRHRHGSRGHGGRPGRGGRLPLRPPGHRRVTVG